jgi:hypothetical protein
MNKKIYYILLTLILCFVTSSIIYPMKVIGLSDEAQSYVDYLADKYGDNSSEPDSSNESPSSTPNSNGEPGEINFDSNTGTLINEPDLNDYNKVDEALIPASPEVLEKIENEGYQYNPPVVNYYEKKDDNNNVANSNGNGNGHVPSGGGGCEDGEDSSTSPSSDFDDDDNNNWPSHDSDDNSPSGNTRVYGCYQCRGAVCRLRYFSTPCRNLCVSNSDCSSATRVTTTTTVPPCTITKFELPNRAWVDIQTTASWSTNNCTTAQINCISDDCIEGVEDLSGSVNPGFNQSKDFTIKAPGTYRYELVACIGPIPADPHNDEDCDVYEDVLGTGDPFIEIEALHLPWWQEIIPSNLQGFLRGLLEF